MTRHDDRLSALVAGRGDALVRYAFLLCGDRGTAEDLVQDALVRAFSRLRPPPEPPRSPDELTLHGPDGRTTIEHLEAYVRATILRGYLDSYRRRQRWTVRLPLVAGPDRHEGPEAAVADRTDLEAGLARLSPRQRACVVLRFHEDMTVPQVAHELGIAEGTVKRHLHDAMNALKTTIGTPTGKVTR
ncbi:RNA polymerase sigma-70 factor (ECF subfamily) [Sediminihabitans luteus]|uniref:RNA polymerase sigma-70 factor (ECF subfamily) n=1 Tax=Sediminihabitans luteus TaxID=1138585 RepID=A0A2M9D012_9CELL|nr:sigma-70 family RNA polymerase sigma factor [Sediminihabitans luteus]PJJ77536.1 RNA polymerase sigma-70 factor (ECF subfamily) [Sediminihabitans luteus]GII98435.1 RNA polymerase subunit sigma-24 [Sediminihabitans luteus]